MSLIGWDLAGLIVVGIPATLGAVFGGIALVRQQTAREETAAVSAKQDQAQAKIDTIRDQVQNGHPNPLREDIDRHPRRPDRPTESRDDRGSTHRHQRASEGHRHRCAKRLRAEGSERTTRRHRADVRDLWHGIKRVEKSVASYHPGKLDKHLGQE
jgi:hypothetical protein